LSFKFQSSLIFIISELHCLSSVYVGALNFVTSFIMHLCNLSLNQTTWPNVGQNAEKCDRICGNLRYICEF